MQLCNKGGMDKSSISYMRGVLRLLPQCWETNVEVSKRILKRTSEQNEN